MPGGTSGIFTAETVVARPGEERLSELDTVLTLYRETTEGNSTIREMIARNDDTFSRDSLVDIRLDTTLDDSDVTYYVAVTSTGNTNFNPELHDSGYGGRSEGNYQLNLSFKEDRGATEDGPTTILDATGTALDGDQNGIAGGTFKYWFKTASPENIQFVDKIATDATANVAAVAYANVASEALADVVSDVIDSNTIELTSVDGIEEGMLVLGATLPKASATDRILVDSTDPVTQTITVRQEGSTDPASVSLSVDDSLRFVTEIVDSNTIELTSVAGIEEGMFVLGKNLPSQSDADRILIESIDPDTQTITVRQEGSDDPASVSLFGGDRLGFVTEVVASDTVQVTSTAGIEKGMLVFGSTLPIQSDTNRIVVDDFDEDTQRIFVREEGLVASASVASKVSADVASEISADVTSEVVDSDTIEVTRITGIEEGMLVLGSTLPAASETDRIFVDAIDPVTQTITVRQEESDDAASVSLSVGDSLRFVTEIVDSDTIELTSVAGIEKGMLVLESTLPAASDTNRIFVDAIDSATQTITVRQEGSDDPASVSLLGGDSLQFVTEISLQFGTEIIDSNTIEVTDIDGIEEGMFVFGSTLPTPFDTGRILVEAIDPVTQTITVEQEGSADAASFSLLGGDSLRFVASAPVSLEVDDILRFVTPGDGSLENPFLAIDEAVQAMADKGTGIIRIVGNDEMGLPTANTVSGRPLLRPGAARAVINDYHYYIGTNDQGNSLSDGKEFNVPAGVTVMVDAGATFRMSKSNVDVGSSSQLESRAGASLQLLGIPGKPVEFSSTMAEAVQRSRNPSPSDSNVDAINMPAGTYTSADASKWGGIVLREDSDAGVPGVFLNSLQYTTLSYGGGQVIVDSQPDFFSPIQIESTRPSLSNNVITVNANAGIAATPMRSLKTVNAWVWSCLAIPFSRIQSMAYLLIFEQSLEHLLKRSMFLLDSQVLKLPMSYKRIC